MNQKCIDLIQRLRDFDPHLHEWEVVDEAADYIEVIQELLDAYQDIIDYGSLVFATNAQWVKLNDAKDNLEGLKDE